MFQKILELVYMILNFIIKPISKYGWIPDLPDIRDNKYEIPATLTVIPDKIDLREGCPDVYDQSSLGSCTANAIAGTIQFLQIKEKINVFMPSRLFIYYNERKREGTVNVDSGARIRTGIKTVNSDGVCPETMWKYIISMFKKQPTSNCYNEAKKHPAVIYKRLDRDLRQMKACLTQGFPFVLGISVYDSFEGDDVAQTGVVPMPTAGERCLGGHAVMAVGYDEAKQCFVIRNSWGTGWGDKGYFYLPYGFITDSNLSDDFWCIELVK